ncbi:MAG: hypothetical protein ACOX6W_08475 [Lentisphaeria bacterium]
MKTNDLLIMHLFFLVFSPIIVFGIRFGDRERAVALDFCYLLIMRWRGHEEVVVCLGGIGGFMCGIVVSECVSAVAGIASRPSGFGFADAAGVAKCA